MRVALVLILQNIVEYIDKKEYLRRVRDGCYNNKWKGAALLNEPTGELMVVRRRVQKFGVCEKFKEPKELH